MGILQELGIGVVDPGLGMVQCLVSLLPYQAGIRMRGILYRAAGMQIGVGTALWGRIHLLGGPKPARFVKIGAGCLFNAPVTFDASAPITIGDNVTVSFGTTFITSRHKTDDPARRGGQFYAEPITVGNGVWIAANVTIHPGVTIGDGVVIEAGSVITENVPEHVVVAGNPAVVKRALPKPGAKGNET